MASNLNNVKISLRTDELSNWNAVNPILKKGEIAIVIDNGTENLKIGNGISSFSDLKYLNQEEVKSDKVTAKEVTAKSISQGYNVKSTPTSLATGIFAEADGNFDVVHGIEVKAKEGDDYAFVFNGENLPGIADRYESHGEGTFNVNPLNGLCGFYIGEENLSSILSHYFQSSEISDYYMKSETSSSTQINTAIQTLQTQKISHGQVSSTNLFGDTDSLLTQKLHLDGQDIYVPKTSDAHNTTFYIDYSSSLGSGWIPPVSDRCWSIGSTHKFYMFYGEENPFVHGEFYVYEPTSDDPLVFQITTTEDSPVQLTADILYGQNLTFDNLYDCQDHKYSWSIPFGENTITCSIQLIPYYDAHAYPREYIDNKYYKKSETSSASELSTFFNNSEKNFIHLSGDSNIGDLNLSGNIVLGPIGTALCGSIAMGYEYEDGQLTNAASATGQNSFALGKGCEAAGEFSFAHGSSAHATGNRSFSTGYHTEATKVHTFAQGQSVSAMAAYSHAEGKQTQTITGFASHAEGESTTAIGLASHAEGFKTFSIGANSHAEGNSTSAYTDYSHAEGEYNIVSSNHSTIKGGHVEGYKNNNYGAASHAEGSNNEIKPNSIASHIEGDHNSISGNYDFVTGSYNNSTGNYNLVGGYDAKVTDSNNTLAIGTNLRATGITNATVLGTKAALLAGGDNSFIWSGTGSWYQQTRSGIFGINPTNGINGFYIGQKNLSAIIDDTNPDPFKTLTLIKPYSDHPLYIILYVSDNIELSGSSIINSKTSRTFFKGFSSGTWQTQLSSGFGVEYNDSPIVVDFRGILNNFGRKPTPTTTMYAKYNWYWTDSAGNDHHSNWYSVAVPTNTEAGANSRDVASKREFNDLTFKVTPQNADTGLDAEYGTYYEIKRTEFNNLTATIQNNDKILLNDYSVNATYRMKFTTATGSSNVSLKFYVDLGNGPEYDSTLAINTNAFMPNTTYIVEIRHDSLIIDRINSQDIVNYLKENSNSVTLRIWNG